ncbi:short-chain dehydrogenase [Nocardiopsis kunsanensis]|uniref:Short-chain dehydrogenase n=1 Tax=Nocardiopsis kunsanensis TaxID=141693 RepID=A0A918X831_9ACTN|nr:SDR family oxidoreductase [Nocardiopsis kunsanensis]GHD17604.1 short-chain dehydrogenase [Nocardiopsis kunsanensis]
MGRYEGKKAVVTGGTHGVGMAVVEALVDGGAEVLVTGLDEENIKEARNLLSSSKAHVVRSDAADMDDIDALGDQVEERFGEVDFVFINVGHIRFAKLEDVTEEQYDRMFDTNTKGAFFTTQRLAPLVKEGGSFVLTTAVVTQLGFLATSVGTGMKAAINAFVRVFAAELVERGIRVNAVSPGFIDTPTMGVGADTNEALRRANEEEGTRMTPMGRFGTPEEVAEAVLHLGFGAGFTTGATLPVDGGLGQGLEPPHEVVTH